MVLAGPPVEPPMKQDMELVGPPTKKVLAGPSMEQDMELAGPSAEHPMTQDMELVGPQPKKVSAGPSMEQDMEFYDVLLLFCLCF